MSFGLHGSERKDELGLGKRGEDSILTSIGHLGSNLPSIAFCNTQDDPQGRFLAIGELNGYVHLHELEPNAKPLQLIQAGFCRTTAGPEGQPYCLCPDKSSFPHSTWGLSFIDRHAFRLISGYVPEANKTWDQHWNGSHMRLVVPDSSRKCA